MLTWPVSSSDIALVFRWLLPLWLLGWLVFPVSRRLFSFLPDQGLAVGRVGALVGGSLAAFWTAQVHFLPLSVGVWFLPVLAICCAFGWRRLRLGTLRDKGALLLSDGVFILAFAVFIWVRLRHPSLNDLEKPMDLALLSSSARAESLPFEHFWFAGVPFTNYYEFGPFMGGTLARLLGTPAPLAYNLVQPLFCALFLSVLWSLGAALTRSKWLGVGVMALVGLGGHLEPLRQMREGAAWNGLDWWATSRVIERVPNATGTGFDTHTINEYPAFTMLIGDAHAHFYALCLAAAHFCVCLGVVGVESRRKRAALIALGGAMVGVLAITNTWDAPFYGLLWALCCFTASRKDRSDQGILPDSSLPEASANPFDQSISTAFLWGLALAVAVAGPFFARFQSQIGGGGFALWLPDAFGFALFWGAWIVLGALGFGFGTGKITPSRDGDFRRLLLLVGVLALLFPSIYYLGGVFAGSNLKHQDTVFKFYLQAWLLGGTAIGSEFLLRFRAWSRSLRLAPRAVGVAFLALLAGVLSLAPNAVLKTRTQGYGEAGLSLDGTQWLPQSDRKAIAWLRERNGVVAERLSTDNGGDYDANRGTIGTFAGLPQVLCWPGHVRAWGFGSEATRAAKQKAGEAGADEKQAQTDAVNAQINGRTADLNAIFTGDPATRKTLVQKLGASFLVVRPGDAPIDDPNFQSHEFVGDDGSKTTILERSGF